MVDRTSTVMWEHGLKSALPWWNITSGMRANSLRRKRQRRARIAEEAKNAIHKAVQRLPSDPRAITEHDAQKIAKYLKAFSDAQKREAEFFRRTIHDLVPEIVAAQERMDAVGEQLNALVANPIIGSTVGELKGELAKARSKFQEALNDAFYLINERRIGKK